MTTKDTNKWALERMRESVNVLLKKAGMEPLLVKVLSDLIWVVDHQQDEIEHLRATRNTVIEAMAKEVEPRWYNEIGKWGCEFCTEESYNKRLFKHSDACPVTQARALLGLREAEFN